MKKIAFIVLLTAGFAAIGAQAQSKTGYISLEELILQMPEFKKVDSTLKEYQEALGDKYNDMIKEFNEQDSLLSGKDTLKFTRAQLEVKRKSLGELYVKLQGWNEQARQQLSQKQQDLLAPVQKKAIEAVQAVAKESGYSYIISKEAVLVGPPADDVLPLVKKKLNIK